MAALSPRLRWALAAVLALTVFVALQPQEDDDLAVERPGRPDRGRPEAADNARGPGGDAQAQAAMGARQTSRGRTVEPGAAEARQLAQLAALWQQRQAPPLTALSVAPVRGAAVPQAPLQPVMAGPWASQLPPPPPPPPPAPVVVEAPQAPRFPYKWVGRYVDDSPRAVVAGPSQTWVLRRGDLLEGQWRVDAIGERQMTLMYLPLNQTQAVDLK